MATYVPGDRVWVQMDGYPWWPARVITRENLSTLMEAAQDTTLDLDLLFYSGLTTAKSVLQLSSRRDAHRVCFFEASSEKAVTSDEDLAEAIRHATEDPTANPIRAEASASGVGATAGTAAPSHDAAISRSTVDEVSRKRQRDADEPAPLPAHYEILGNTELMSVAAALTAATTSNDVSAARRELLRLDRVDATLEQLRDTKIGVAVGNVKKSEACRPLWPLARAIISFWARKLPSETIKALKELQGQQAAPSLRVPGMAELQYPASPNGPASPWSVLSPGGRRSAFSQPASPGGATGGEPGRTRRLGFQEQLYQALNNPLSAKQYADERINEVIREIRNQKLDEDDRLELLQRLRTDEIGEKIRDALLSGDWTLKQYMEMPREAFLTTAEIDNAEHRVKEKIAEEERAKTANLNVTAMFECPECHAKNATYFEMQTRGADEPTTKFITCLECGLTWRDE